jgi:hypothetical protein
VSELYANICKWSALILVGSLLLMLVYFMKMLPNVDSKGPRNQEALINQTERGSVDEMVIELSDTEIETEDSKPLLPSM